MYFDVWNEPNSLLRRDCLANPKCPFDANMTAEVFFRLHDAAFHTLRRELPDARVVAPSIADGGPGIAGFSSVLPWLKAFLTHAHAAGTLPDVLA